MHMVYCMSSTGKSVVGGTENDAARCHPSLAFCRCWQWFSSKAWQAILVTPFVSVPYCALEVLEISAAVLDVSLYAVFELLVRVSLLSMALREFTIEKLLRKLGLIHVDDMP